MSSDVIESVTSQNSKEKPVLVMDSQGNVERIKNVHETCKRFGMHFNDLTTHLLQKSAGCVVYEGYRFKYDNQNPWCDALVHPKAISKLRRIYRTTATNQVTREKWTFSTLIEAVRILGLSKSEIMYDFRKYKEYKTRDGLWTFSIDESNNERPRRKSIVALNRTTGEEKRFESSRSCSKKMGIPHNFLADHLKSDFGGLLPWNGFFFRYEENEPTRNIQYLIPDSTAIGKAIRFVVYKQGDDTPYLLTSIQDLCKHYGWDIGNFYTYRYRNGTTKPYKGLTVVNIDDVDIENL